MFLTRLNYVPKLEQAEESLGKKLPSSFCILNRKWKQKGIDWPEALIL